MYIAIEWTSAAFRALLLDDETALGEKKSDRGTTKVAAGDFETALREEPGTGSTRRKRSCCPA
ncbi:hypothetical protein LZK73_14710 [Neorhizobium galegae]|nr:hypothetical protein LZK73_14710 [Neorhizobium galegae]